VPATPPMSSIARRRPVRRQSKSGTQGPKGIPSVRRPFAALSRAPRRRKPWISRGFRSERATGIEPATSSLGGLLWPSGEGRDKPERLSLCGDLRRSRSDPRKDRQTRTKGNGSPSKPRRDIGLSPSRGARARRVREHRGARLAYRLAQVGGGPERRWPLSCHDTIKYQRSLGRNIAPVSRLCCECGCRATVRPGRRGPPGRFATDRCHSRAWDRSHPRVLDLRLQRAHDGPGSKRTRPSSG